MLAKAKGRCNHEENRFKVCAICAEKIVFGSNSRSKFIISDAIETLIKNYCNSDFNVDDSRFPKSVCLSCRVKLYERNRQVFRPLPTMPRYLDIQLLKRTRTSSTSEVECCCFICRIAKQKTHRKTELGKGVTKKSKSITSNNGLFGAKKTVAIEKIDVITQNEDTETQTLKICKICFAEIVKGKAHLCNRNSAHKNMIKKIESLPERTQDNLIHELLTTKAKASDSASSLQNVELNLKTRGRNARLIINPEHKNPVYFSEEKLDNFVANTGMSLNVVGQFTNFIRSSAGRKSIPSYYRRHASQKAKSLEDVYETGIYNFDIEKEPEKQKRPTVYADAETLLNSVLEARGQHGEVAIKLMVDGGKGFFKISMTILPKDYCEEMYGSDDEEIPAKKSRSTYIDGGSLGKKSNLNGVNRLILLCAVPNIKETYDNVELLWNLMKMNEIPYKFVSDYKLLLIMIGQQTATSTYPCPFCFITLDVMRSGNVGQKVSCSEEGENELKISEECLKLKTFGDIRTSYNKFVSLKSDKKLAKNCHSTINLPIFDEPDDMPIIEKVIIPELHEIQGIVNHIFFDGLVPLLGEENAFKWPKKLNLISKHYHGEKFEGNACRRLLKESDILYDKAVLQDTPTFKIVPFIQTLKALNKLVNSAFKSGQTNDEWKKNVEELKRCYPATGLSQTLKVHVLLEHLEHGLHFLGGDSLGLWSEQAGESVHREFLKY